jgi:uncharacterized membrane protein YccC
MFNSKALSRLDRQALLHASRNAVAAIVSLTLARLLKLPEAYWAAITTLIVMQSTLGAAWTVSWQRLAGTALGAIAGALLTPHFGASALAFGIGVFAMGVLLVLLHLEQAYRFANITLAIIMLINRVQPAWDIALHRFLEVAVGIAIALLITGLWPEPETASS